MTETQIVSDEPGEESPETIVSRFERCARCIQDNVAVVTPAAVFTYRELDNLAQQMATCIDRLAADRERPIGFLMHEGPLLYSAMLGAAKAGRIFIPFETTITEARLSQLIALSGASHVLADELCAVTAKKAAGTEAIVLNLDELRRDTPSAVPVVLSGWDPPACILYTSGSTGQPKGVLLGQRSLVQGADAMGGPLRIGIGDRVGTIRSSGYSAGLNNVFMTLLRGGCLLPFDVRQGMHKLSSWLDTEEIARLTVTSSFFRTWIASLPEGHRFRTLSTLWVGGEPLYGSDVELASQHLAGDWRVVHGFSSTETHPAVTRTLGPGVPHERGVLAVRDPARLSTIVLEDRDGQESPPGAPGEIIVKNPFVALGYWKDPEGTARSFGVDETGNRFFRSGDIGRWRSDGMLEHLGRKGRKIKLRGYAIEPFEVERALLRLEGIRDAAVVVSEAGPDQDKLVAYAVLTGEPPADRGKRILDALRADLPAPMVPAQIVFVDSLRLTSRGKIDRSALPAPPRPEREIRAPADDTERALMRIWCDVLETADIGVDEDFYDVGGTSLQAFLVFAQIAGRLGHDLPPTTMLEAPTITKQASLLRSGHAERKSSKLVAFRDHGSDPPLFLVHAAYGDIEYARELSRHLKSDRAVYALRPPPLDGSQYVPRSVERMAADYIREIRTIQPSGPYFLGGYSFGGLVAYEIALQLWERKESVSFLALIDTLGKLTPPPFPLPPPKPKRSLSQIAAAARSDATENLALRLAAARLRTLRVLPKGRLAQIIGPPDYALRPQLYLKLARRASRRYVPRPYAGEVTLFSAQGWKDHHTENWQPLACGGLRVTEFSAGHDDIVLSPHSAMLAAELDRSLEPFVTRLLAAT